MNADDLLRRLEDWTLAAPDDVDGYRVSQAGRDGAWTTVALLAAEASPWEPRAGAEGTAVARFNGPPSQALADVLLGEGPGRYRIHALVDGRARTSLVIAHDVDPSPAGGAAVDTPATVALAQALARALSEQGRAQVAIMDAAGRLLEQARGQLDAAEQGRQAAEVRAHDAMMRCLELQLEHAAEVVDDAAAAAEDAVAAADEAVAAAEVEGATSALAALLADPSTAEPARLALGAILAAVPGALAKLAEALPAIVARLNTPKPAAIPAPVTTQPKPADAGPKEAT